MSKDINKKENIVFSFLFLGIEMVNRSDHKKPATTITNLLPDVYKSEVSQSVNSTSFDRFLTKDDTIRVAGYVGQRSQSNKQIAESTVHQQGYQLAPTMVTSIGAQTVALSWKSFLGQLKLTGVDIDRLAQWGSTLQFNWVPPINLDMFVNYSDYFWIPSSPTDIPQYFTIEEKCSKIKNAAQLITTAVNNHGSNFEIIQIDYINNKFIISGDHSDLFAIGVQFQTVNGSPTERLNDVTWLITAVSYDRETNTTTITVFEPIAIVQSTAPVSPSDNSWWLNSDTNTLYCYIDQQWKETILKQQGDLSLAKVVIEYQRAAACACYHDYGWDQSQWGSQWDYTSDCNYPTYNSWSIENKWIHKSLLQTTVGAIRAKMPILEYSSDIELNTWIEYQHQWFYRASPSFKFEVTNNRPTRIELEPIKGYIVDYSQQQWRIFLFADNQAIDLDIDYRSIFTPGFKFIIKDDNQGAIYTTKFSEYRQLTSSDPVAVTNVTSIGPMCTIVYIEESVFSSPVQGGSFAHSRIEPITTSNGDPWSGYHAHWMVDISAVNSIAASNQPLSTFYNIDNNSVPTYITPPAGFSPQSSTIIATGNTYQQVTITTDDVDQVDVISKFHPKLKSSRYAVAGGDDLRVYINGQRQYFNYTEILQSFIPPATFVGNAVVTNTPIRFVKSIKFNNKLNQSDVVRFEIGPSSEHDVGWNSVPVRTIEDEKEFTLAVVAGTQPVYSSVHRYGKHEQMKPSALQYPMFNIYDLIDHTVVSGSPIFKYQEDSQYPVAKPIQRRVVVTGTNDYHFEQDLVDNDNHIMFGYRELTDQYDFWYDVNNNQVLKWVNQTWTKNIPVRLANQSYAVRNVLIAPTEPVEYRNIEQQYWFNSTTNQLFVRQQNQWNQINSIVIQSSDPTIRTIWRHGQYDEQAIPKYVDSNRQPVAVGDSDGDWGVIDQWTFNSEHKNYKTVSFTHIYTHFASILAAQTPTPGLPSRGIFTKTQDMYNYGVGGTIKEHNHSFDSLISAINVNNVTPVGVIEFVGREYQSALLWIHDCFARTPTKFFTDISDQSFINQQDVITNAVINQYQINEQSSQNYGDSSAFDQDTNKGVRNWIATAPMFGLGKLYQPQLISSPNGIELIHHDGHRSKIELSALEQDRICRMICSTSDDRINNQKFGVVSTHNYPLTTTDFIANFGSIRNGVYWYRVISGQRQLYRFIPLFVQSEQPSMLEPEVNQLPDHVIFFDTVTENSYEKIGNQWMQIGLSGDISKLWQKIDLVDQLGQTMLQLENRLYEVTPTIASKIDLTPPNSTDSTFAEYVKLMKERFVSFVTNTDIQYPFINNTYNLTDPFSWNYKLSTLVTPPTNSKPVILFADWHCLYQYWYGTSSPDKQPWIIQQYHTKPDWWDQQYQDQTGTRDWKPVMWQNILNRIVPVGKLTPNNTISNGQTLTSLPKYNYLSIDITTDKLLPPYYQTNSATSRSLFSQYSNIVAPDSDYQFGDGSPSEWQWQSSIQYNYDQLIVQYQLNPVTFIDQTFGTEYTLVDKLQIETTYKQVYSHEEAMFHGDIYDTNKVYLVRGLNQWYVNYNRFTGFDTNNTFRTRWVGWNPKLTYQFNNIIDTSSLEVRNPNYDIVDQDYQVILANSGILSDQYVDSFNINLIKTAPALVQYNNQAAWQFELDVISAIPREISYYGVRSYPFTIRNNQFVAFNFNIVTVDHEGNRLFVENNVVQWFDKQQKFTITANGNTYGPFTAISAVFDNSSQITRINLSTIINSNITQGVLDVVEYKLPWIVGDQIVVSSSKFLPAPLSPDKVYYIIPTGDRTFKLALSYQDSISNNSIVTTSLGQGQFNIAEIFSSFFVFGGNGNSAERWYHYVLDKTIVNKITPPVGIQGMQSVINLFDGYAAYKKDNTNIAYNVVENNENFDPDTGRQLGWEVEVERFINWAYGIRQAKLYINDSYPVTVDIVNNTLIFQSTIPFWRNGTIVSVQSTGTLPTPLIAQQPYYVVATGQPNQIKLSISPDVSDSSSYVDFTSTGIGTIVVSLYDRRSAYPQFEINPSRYNIFINTPIGLLSNVVDGPYVDTRIKQTIYDQYNRPLTADQINVFRQDERSEIALLVDSIEENNIQTDYYTRVHFGGAHLFVEGYQHYLIFNDYTVSDNLIYDQFYGLMTKRFNLDFYRKSKSTMRPTLGGYYLTQQHFERNIEGSVGDFQDFYDSYELVESSDIAKNARHLLGYKKNKQYLTTLGVGSKSQFLFYKGMIQSKGSTNSIKGYTNSKYFLDAKVDEFWAYKIANFGDKRIRVYPEIKLLSTDSLFDDIRLQFLARRDDITTIAQTTNDGFQIIGFNDDKRWNNLPEQRAEIISPLFLDAKRAQVMVIYSNPIEPPNNSNVDYWIDSSGSQLVIKKLVNNNWTVDNSNIFTFDTIKDQNQNDLDVCYIRHQIADGVRGLKRVIDQTNHIIGNQVSTIGSNQLIFQSDVTNYFQPQSKIVIIPANQPKFIATVVSSEYNQVITTVTIDNNLSIDLRGGSVTTYKFEKYQTEIIDPGQGGNQYISINSETIRFNTNSLTDVIILFTITPAAEKINPARLVDTKSNTMVQTIPLWHPAIGLNSPIAAHNVDITSAIDPAGYQFTLSPNSKFKQINFWNQPEIDTIWFDTSAVNYLPYYDTTIYPNTNDRLYNWGKLSQWGDIGVYQWVKSPVAPDQWDQYVTDHENDITMSAEDKPSGTPRLVVNKRTRKHYSGTIDSSSTIQVASNLFTVGQQILFVEAGQLSTIERGVKYIVSAVIHVNSTTDQIEIEDPYLEQTLDFVNIGQVVTITPAFVDQMWFEKPLLVNRLNAGQVAVQYKETIGTTQSTVWPLQLASNLLSWIPDDITQWEPQDDDLSVEQPDTVNVYINGKIVEINAVVKQDSNKLVIELTSDLTINENDFIDIVRPLYQVSYQEQQFDPDLIDDGTTNVQWKYDTPYSLSETISGSELTGYTTQRYYYFWVRDRLNRNRNVNTDLSASEVRQQLTTIPTGYFVVQQPEDDSSLSEKYGYGMIEYGSIWSLGNITESMYIVPVQYRRCVLRKISSYLTDDDRFIIQFTRDWTLRDNLEYNQKFINLKEKHQQWVMFRRNQPGKIDKMLWEKLKQSVVGYKQTTVSVYDPVDSVWIEQQTTVRVPSLERQLYDDQYQTETQYGLQDGQTFADREYALATIISYLTNPNIDFAPINIDMFFALQNFNSPEAISAAMDEIYTTFPPNIVNDIWFETLLDALSTRTKYTGIIKTSWIALHGVRLINVNGKLDE